MPPRRRSRDLILTIEEEFKRIYTSVSFTLFKGKVCDYDSSEAESSFLSPDQDAVDDFFVRTGGLIRPEVRNVLEAYFYSTVKACELYRTLLKGIQVARQNQTCINQALHLVQIVQQEGNNPSHSLHISVLEELKTFAASENPFPQETLDHFHLVQEENDQLAQELAERMKTLDTKLRKARTRNKVLPYIVLAAGSPVLLCFALPATLAGMVVAALSDDVLATLRPWWLAVKGRFSNYELEAQCAQLDAASKGNYIIIQDLMTVRRQVTRLRNDVESNKSRILFFEKTMEDYGCLCVVAQQLRMSSAISEQQMKDFSEQVVLCCRTLEKARKLVFEKITGHQWNGPQQIDIGVADSSDDD